VAEEGGGEHDEAGPAREARDPRTEDLWERAADGDVGDLTRLFDHEGESEILERAAIPTYRMTALAALAYAEDFMALPFLADVASTGTEIEASVALESAHALAALPERARDPEDALELGEGCGRLATLAHRESAPAHRRARALSILRMLASTGCRAGTTTPVDLDPKDASVR
jgi:hypothetical protein